MSKNNIAKETFQKVELPKTYLNLSEIIDMLTVKASKKKFTAYAVIPGVEYFDKPVSNFRYVLVNSKGEVTYTTMPPQIES